MRWERLGRIALIGAVATTVANLLATLITTFTYRPTMAQAWGDVYPDDGVPSSEVLVAAQRLSQLLALVLVLAGSMAVLIHLGRGRTRTIVVTTVAAVGAFVGTLASVLTLALVRWDQLALWSVTVGTNYQGYDAAAFADDVRFVLVDGIEVSQGDYRAALLVHVAAPVVALVGLALLWRANRPGADDARIDPAPHSSHGFPDSPPLATSTS